MNMFDKNCTFTLSLPVISLIDNKRQVTPATTSLTPFNMQNFVNYQNVYTTAPTVVAAQPSNESNTNSNVMESDLTELSWLTNSLDLFKENLTSSSPPISAKLISLTKSNNKKYENEQKVKLKSLNDTFLKTSFIKVKSFGNRNSSLLDFNGDLDSSFSSSASTSSSSSINSANENNESFSKYSNNLESIFLKQKLQHINNNTNNSKDHDISNGITAIKKMKLNEYSGSDNNNNDNKNQAATQIKIEITDFQAIAKPINSNNNNNNNNNQLIATQNEQINKPPLTLSCLIFMAIQESKYKCLPVREIYEWIENNFPYYKFAKTGWKSSIRHNLSFSKCFKKMDRLESCKFLTNNNQNLVNNNSKQKLASKTMTNYNQRVSYIAGTCWQVNPECKAYLMHMLKKSSFWFKYNKSYPNLTKLMENYYNNEENLQQANNHSHHHHSHKSSGKIEETTSKDDANNKIDEKLNEENFYTNLSSFNSSDNENYFDEIDDSNNEKSNDNNVSEEDDDVTKAAEILYKNSCLIKNLPLIKQEPFNNTCSDSYNSNNEIVLNSINSDLEIEVASTLVRLKSLIEIRS